MNRGNKTPREWIKEVNDNLFIHKGIHSHYIIDVELQDDNTFLETAMAESFEFGIATAQAHYSKEFSGLKEQFKTMTKEEILDFLGDYWKPFNTKEHLENCLVCQDYYEKLKDGDLK